MLLISCLKRRRVSYEHFQFFKTWLASPSRCHYIWPLDDRCDALKVHDRRTDCTCRSRPYWLYSTTVCHLSMTYDMTWHDRYDMYDMYDTYVIGHIPDRSPLLEVLWPHNTSIPFENVFDVFDVELANLLTPILGPVLNTKASLKVFLGYRGNRVLFKPSPCSS